MATGEDTVQSGPSSEVYVNPWLIAVVVSLAAINGVAQQLMHSGMNSSDAQRHALARFYSGVQAQSTTLAYIDTYFVISVAAGIMFLLSFTLRGNNPRATPKVSAH